VEAAALAHPVFEPLRDLLHGAGSPGNAAIDRLNALAESAGVRVRSGKLLRFTPPADVPGRYGDYEIRVYETGCVETRPDNLHDYFNALAWLAFPAVKAELNALHARHIPLEGGRRGRFRDLLTLFDEGGAIVACDDADLVGMVRAHRWKELFWENRERVLHSMRVHVLGHAVLEQSLHPWPGITCKLAFVATSDDADEQAAAWLRKLPDAATPRDMASLPIFGYPGWYPSGERGELYDDARYFRPLTAAPAG
jgi:hypothetical protein